MKLLLKSLKVATFTTIALTAAHHGTVQAAMVQAPCTPPTLHIEGLLVSPSHRPICHNQGAM